MSKAVAAFGYKAEFVRLEHIIFRYLNIGKLMRKDKKTDSKEELCCPFSYTVGFGASSPKLFGNGCCDAYRIDGYVYT